jgi:hypothetical protein
MKFAIGDIVWISSMAMGSYVSKELFKPWQGVITNTPDNDSPLRGVRAYTIQDIDYSTSQLYAYNFEGRDNNMFRTYKEAYNKCIQDLTNHIEHLESETCRWREELNNMRTHLATYNEYDKEQNNVHT